jgi:hypothetical protein
VVDGAIVAERVIALATAVDVEIEVEIVANFPFEPSAVAVVEIDMTADVVTSWEVSWAESESESGSGKAFLTERSQSATAILPNTTDMVAHDWMVDVAEQDEEIEQVNEFVISLPAKAVVVRERGDWAYTLASLVAEPEDVTDSWVLIEAGFVMLADMVVAVVMVAEPLAFSEPPTWAVIEEAIVIEAVSFTVR